MLIIDDTLTEFLPDKNIFNYLMSLTGKTFREVENRRTQQVKIANENYFLKQHFGTGWKEILKNLSQGKFPVLGATNEWLAAKKLNTLSIPTITVVAYGKRGLNPARQQSFLLTKELTNTISLEDYCHDWKITPPSFALKQRLIAEVARIVHCMHANGINHRDCYICHFLVDKDQNDKLFVIDLHRAQIRKCTPERWVIKDLAGLYFSSKDIGLTQRDLLRFIKSYTQKPLRDVLQDLKHTNFWNKVKKSGEQLYNRH